MSLIPLINASLAIQIHVAVAVMAILLTLAIFAMRRGTRTHRLMGRVWVSAMALVALSSFFIFEIRLLGPFSPIHLVSIYVLANLVYAVRAARQGRIEAHRKAMTGMVWGGLVGAGAFTFLPGRLMHAVLLGG